MLKVPRWFVLLAFAALALRFLLLREYRLSPFQWGLTLDDWKYWNMASEIARGGWMPTEVFAQGPLYSYLLGFVMTLFPSLSIPAVSAFQLFLNWVTCLLLYPLTGRLAGRGAGLTAASLGLFFAPAVFFSLKVLAITLGLFLLVAGVLLLLGGEGRKRVAAAGLLFGLAALATPSVLPTAAAAALMLALRNTGTQRLAAPALFLLCFFITILPATVSNYLQDGSRVLISANHGINFHIGNNPNAVGLASMVEGVSADAAGQESDSIALARREAGRFLNKGEVAGHFFGKGLAFIAEHPLSYLRLVGQKTLLLLSGIDFSNEFSLVRERRDHLALLRFFPLAGTAVILLSAVALSREGVLMQLRWYLLIPLSQAAVSLVYFNANRHVLAFQFLSIPIAAAGLALGWRGLKLIPAGIASAAIVGSFLYAAREARAPYHEVFYQSTLMMAYNDRESFRESIAVYEEAALRFHPSRPMIRMAARAYAAVGDVPAAVEVYRRALDRYPKDREVTLAAAAFLGGVGRETEALGLYRERLRANPGDMGARVLLAQLLVERGRDGEAEEEVREVLARDPLSADARYLLGVLFLRRGETGQGIEGIERALEISPRLSAEAYYFLAMAYLKRGEPEAAREHLARAEVMGYPVPEESRARVSAPPGREKGR